ncbi:MAG: acyltransferase family protein [Flavobacteriales bacterium]|nr:acyltransferase family protein [Flavobacteriales bacterium]
MRSTELMEGLWYPMTLLNVWRIPLLFFISGMGVYFAMQKRSPKKLLLERGKRILLPYLFGILAIVPLHYLIFQDFYGQELSYFAHPSHLWFLGNIAIYILILFPLFYHLLKKKEGKFRRILSRIFSNPFGPLVMAIFFVIEVLIVDPQIFSQYALTPHGYANGFLSFFFGFLLAYVGQPFWKAVKKWKYIYLHLAAILFTYRFFVNDTAGPNYLIAIESILWIVSLFGFAYQYLNRPSKTLSYLSKAVYPIYIVHMFALYSAAWLILPLEIPVSIQFILIVLITAAICFALYEVIKRIPYLRTAFGMRRPMTQEKIFQNQFNSKTHHLL